MTEEKEITEAIQSLLVDHHHQQKQQQQATTTTTMNDVVRKLESKLGIDLSHKTDFINSQLQQLLHSPQPRNRNDTFALPQNTISPPQQSVHEGVGGSSKGGGGGKTGVMKKKRGGPGGLNKLCGVSPQLQAIVGHPTLPRTEIVKQLWAYIRKHKLQDPNNKRKIICNNELRLVFETDSTDMFKMNKLLAKHIIALEPTKQSGSRRKQEDVAQSGTRQTVSSSGPFVAISEALANCFGVGAGEMPQAEVFMRLWEYIKVNHLEDPSNPMVIQCDSKLQELFGCQSLPASRIPEVLARSHVFRTS